MAELVITDSAHGPHDGRRPFGLSVSVEDAFGNLVTGFNGPVTLSLFDNRSPAARPHSTEISPRRRATAWPRSPASRWTSRRPVTRSCHSIGLNPGDDQPDRRVPAAATQLVVSVPPPTLMIAGAGFGLAVAAEDPFGNLATGFTGNVDNRPGE